MRRRLNGEDVGAFILSENVERRHLTAGQRAMARANDLRGAGEKAAAVRKRSVTKQFPESAYRSRAPSCATRASSGGARRSRARTKRHFKKAFLTKKFDRFSLSSCGISSDDAPLADHSGPAVLERNTMSTTPDKTILLACEDHDFGEVAADRAQAEAKALANEEGKPVYMRDPLTDKVLRVIKPAKKTAAKAVPKAPAKSKPARKAPGKARGEAQAQPAASAAPKARKAATGEPKAPKAPREGGPAGWVVEILKLASRPQGVSPAELNTLTTRKGAPWKWLFSNPRGTGYCDRWGYTFAVLKTDDGLRYQVVKRG
jgi:hypothetical protein